MTSPHTEQSTTPVRAREYLILLSLTLLSTLLMSLFGRWGTGGMELTGVDVAGHYAWLRSPLLDGDFAFANDYEMIMGTVIYDLGGHAEPIPATGLQGNPFPVGAAFALLPGFVIAHGLVKWTPLSQSFEANGVSLPYGIAAHWNLMLWGTVGLFLTHLWLRRRFRARTSLLGLAIAWFGTNAVHYCYPYAINNHSIALAAMPFFLLAWERWLDRGSVGRAIVCGIACGLLFLVRWQLSLWPVVFWIALLIRGTNEGKRPWTMWLVPVVGLVVAFPQFWAWHHIYGSWLTKPQGDAYFEWAHPKMLSLLFSLHRGWISWTPLAGIGVIGCWLLWRRERSLVVCVMVGLLLQLYLSSVVDWHGSWGFSARRFTHATPFVALGIAALLARCDARQLRLAVMSLGVLVVWNGLFLYQHYHHLIPYHRALTWHEFIGDKFHLSASRERRLSVMEAMARVELMETLQMPRDEAQYAHLLNEAQRWAQDAYEIDPNHEDVYLIAAPLAMAVGDFAGAIEVYQLCMEKIDVDHAQLYQSMGVMALKLGNAPLAVQYAQQSLDANPNYTRAQRLLEDASDGRQDEQHPYFFF